MVRGSRCAGLSACFLQKRRLVPAGTLTAAPPHTPGARVLDASLPRSSLCTQLPTASVALLSQPGWLLFLEPQL